MKATPLAKRYYRTLRLNCDASDEVIREAYYRLAFMHHPDRNPGDAYAAARFKEIQIAYEWLSQRRAAPPSLTDGELPFFIPKRSEAGLVWQWLAALAGVAALAVLLTMLLRDTPRTGAILETDTSRPEQLADQGPIAKKLQQQMNIANADFTTASGILIVQSHSDNSPFQRSVTDETEWLAESSVWNLLEPIGGSSVESLAAALDEIFKGSFSPRSLTETWHYGPAWQVTLQHGLPPDLTPITRTLTNSSTKLILNASDQQLLIKDGMVRVSSHSEVPPLLGEISPEWQPLPSTEDFDSLEAVPAQQPKIRRSPISPSLPEITFNGRQPWATQPESANDIAGKWWNGEPGSLFSQKPRPTEATSSQSYEGWNDSEALPLPKKNRQAFSPEVLGNTALPSSRDYSDPALLNIQKRLDSTARRDGLNSLLLLPDQPERISPRQAEKLTGHRSLGKTQYGLQSIERARSAAAESSTWGARSGDKAWGQRSDSLGNFTQNSIRGVESEFSVRGREGAIPKLDWNSQQPSATSSNYASFPTNSKLQIEKSFLSPTASHANVFQKSYLNSPAVPSYRYSAPPMVPYGSSFRATYPEH